jgi:hypothetical protein
VIDPKNVCLYVPAELKTFKLNLFNRIGNKIEKMGGHTIRGDWRPLAKLPDDIVPIVGCGPYLRGLFDEWIARKRSWIYWDRGYFRRVFATWLPRGKPGPNGEGGGFYRWHLNSYQMQTIRDVPEDRWREAKIPLLPWQRNPNGHIVVAVSSPTYEKFHVIEGWQKQTLKALERTGRKIIVRDKESKIPLQEHMAGAYCVVAHGSIAAVEAVICGCPVVVDSSSAAALVGITDLEKIDELVYPDREAWVKSLSYSQYDEIELVDGTLWRLIN